VGTFNAAFGRRFRSVRRAGASRKWGAVRLYHAAEKAGARRTSTVIDAQSLAWPAIWQAQRGTEMVLFPCAGLREIVVDGGKCGSGAPARAAKRVKGTEVLKSQTLFI
jgi:hypothetical protein